MHFWQAIKMAVKSLKTNKLRSFLTMLGIIIGVMTVSLLTSVAQGVTDVVISSVKSQSTLAVFMNMNRKLKFSQTDEILRDSQPEKGADNYFEYSLIYSTTTKVANNSFEVISNSENIKEYFVPKKTYTMDDFPTYNEMSEEEKLFVELLIKPPVHDYFYGTEVMAVDGNFQNVYNLEYDGKYMENSNEIMVDSRFVKTYFGENTTNQEALDKEVTLGIDMYTQIKFKFQSAEDLENKKQIIIDFIENNYANSKTSTMPVEIIYNSDNSSYLIDEEDLSIIINVEMINLVTNNQLVMSLYLMLEDSSIIITAEDLIDTKNAKTYKVVAVVSDDTSSLLSSISTTTNTDTSASNNAKNSALVTYMASLSSSKGLCYMLYDDENAKTFGQEDVSSSTLTYAYLRYNDEKVMNASTTSIIIAFANKGFNYMTDFVLVSFSSVASIISNIMNILTIMLTVISVISLVVGGIGIMNIMLVAVTERTREIGIRKAIGAKKSSILVQFLVEALMLSILGGLIGLGISAIGMMIISHFMGVVLTIPLWVIAMSVGFCTAIGLIFGMFPAVKASNMQPIDALRRD